MKVILIVAVLISMANAQFTKTYHRLYLPTDTADLAKVRTPVVEGDSITADTVFSSALRALRLYSSVATSDSLFSRAIGVGSALRVYNTARTSWVEMSFSDALSSLTMNRAIVPSLDNSFDIGSLSYMWRNGYFKGEVRADTVKAALQGSVNAPTCNSQSGYRVNNGDLLSAFDTGSYSCSLFENTTFRAVAFYRIKYTIIGDKATIYVPDVYASFSGAATAVIHIPPQITPAAQHLFPVYAYVNSITTLCEAWFDPDGTITIRQAGGNLSGGVCGLYVGTAFPVELRLSF